MWAAIANTVLGIWLMFAPSVLAYGPPARTVDHILGPIVATVGAIAIAEATRGARLANLVPAACLAAAPFALDYRLLAGIHSVAVGLAVGGLALSGGRIRRRFGGGWAALWRRTPAEPADPLVRRAVPVQVEARSQDVRQCGARRHGRCDSVGMKTTTAMTSVTLVAAMSAAGCVHAVGEPMDADDEVANLSGTCPNLVFSVEGARVSTDAATRFEDGSCAEVINGKRVEAEGVARDGVLYASEVDLD
jgi:hypothetical protein